MSRWRRQRRIVHEGFNKSAASRFHAAESEEAARLCTTLLHSPSNFRKHYHDYVSSVVLSVTYGRAHDEKLLTGVEAFIRKSQSLARVDALVEVLPWLEWVPGWVAGWKGRALEAYEDSTAFFMGLVDDVEDKMVRILSSRGVEHSRVTS